MNSRNLYCFLLSDSIHAQPITDNTVYQWQVTSGFDQSSQLTPAQRTARETNGTLWLLGGRTPGGSFTLLRVGASLSVTSFQAGKDGIP